VRTFEIFEIGLGPKSTLGFELTDASGDMPRLNLPLVINWSVLK
jgi:hypothetical protein